MIITDRSGQTELFCPVKIKRVFPEGEIREEEDLVISEHLLQIVCGELRMQVVCTPQDLKELVAGRLFSEGLITACDDKEKLELSEDGAAAEVVLTGEITEPGELRPVPSHSFTAQDVFDAAQHFSKGSAIHKKTAGTHSCMLAGREGRIFTAREDISRHNAMDKALGAALLQGISLSETALFTSGRVPTDMMYKVIRAGIPLLISKSVPTVQSVQLAERYGLTLVTSAWPDNFRLVSGYMNT